MLTPEKIQGLCDARLLFITDGESQASLPTYLTAVDKIIEDKCSPEWKEWTAFGDTLLTAYENIVKDGLELDWPEPPTYYLTSKSELGKSGQYDVSNSTTGSASIVPINSESAGPSVTSTGTGSTTISKLESSAANSTNPQKQGRLRGNTGNVKVNGKAAREIVRSEYRRTGQIGPVRTRDDRRGGRNTDPVADQLVIEEKEIDIKGEVVKRVYCIGCDTGVVGRNPLRIKAHARNCSKLQKDYPELHKLAVKALSGKSLTLAVETGDTRNLPALRKQKNHEFDAVVPSNDNSQTLSTNSTDTGSDPAISESNTSVTKKVEGTLFEHFNRTKITVAMQARLDLLLLKLVIRAALPFDVINHPAFREFCYGLASNYVVPERSSFFPIRIASEVEEAGIQLNNFLSGECHLTLSFDGWSSRGKDEIYTVHTTTVSRRSLLMEGLVFDGESVTAQALVERLVGVLDRVGADQYSCVTSDGAANVKLAKKMLTTRYPWILHAHDPCHQLNLFMKDIGKLDDFKQVLSLANALANYFSSSNYGSAQLKKERERLNITRGMTTSCETRFSSTYNVLTAIQRCMPAINNCYVSGTIEFKTKATRKLRDILGSSKAGHFSFMANVASLVKLLAPAANGLLTLEGQNTNCAEVFLVWLNIGWNIKQLGESETGNSLIAALLPELIRNFNSRFQQMMDESSNYMYFLAFYLHPYFRSQCPMTFSMPPLQQGENLQRTQRPEIFNMLLKAALHILSGEQKRKDIGGREQSDALVDQLVSYAYNQSPFNLVTWNSAITPLAWWKLIENDSNANQLARVAIKLYSISPSEICDERTASRLGWFNAARRSSMSAETLVDCVKLYDFYSYGYNTPTSDSQNLYDHHAYLKSMQSLIGSGGEEMAISLEATEAALFCDPDPFDLEEVDRNGSVTSSGSHLNSSNNIRSSNHYSQASSLLISKYIKLDSPILAAFLTGSAQAKQLDVESIVIDSEPDVGKPDDWSMEDYFD